MGDAFAMNRRAFLGGVSALAATAGIRANAAEDINAETACVRKCGRLVPPCKVPRNRRPYSNVDWSNVIRINTTSHLHCDDYIDPRHPERFNAPGERLTAQRQLDDCMRHGFGFLTVSNYYPSGPRMPGATFKRDHYRFHSTHKLNRNGRLVDQPKDWAPILDGLKDKMEPIMRAQLPLKESGELLFSRFPEGLLEVPNGEHHNFRLADGSPARNLHICAPGSAYISGSWDKWSRFGTGKHLGYDIGSGEFWGAAIDRMIDGLVVPDGGGVTINHPGWSQIDRNLLLEILDWDPRVLGLEAMNGGDNDENYWDWVLASGRQCYGFFVPDHSTDKRDFGVNVLLVGERTVEACLRAYRQGNFYGAQHGLGELAFTEISFDGKTLTVRTDRPATFEVKTAEGVVKTEKGTKVVWEVVEDRNSQGPQVDVFVRVKATADDGSGEVLYTQPFMLI